jgi:hypothetical protein
MFPKKVTRGGRCATKIGNSEKIFISCSRCSGSFKNASYAHL